MKREIEQQKLSERYYQGFNQHLLCVEFNCKEFLPRFEALLIFVYGLPI